MKYSVRITVITALLLTSILSCTKEVLLKTEIEFDVTVEHNAQGYVNDNLSTVITLVPEEVLEEFSYSYSYSVTKGQGYFTDRSGEQLPQNESIAFDQFSATLQYVGSKPGNHIIKVTASDNYGFTEEVDIDYTVDEIPPVVWTATSPVERIELGKSAVIMMNFEKSVALADVNYERQYRMTGVSGGLTDSPERNKVAFDKFEAIAPGSFQLNFTPAELGTAELSFVLQGDEGPEFTTELSFEVLEDIVDVSAPVISLLGNDPYIIQRKTEYTDPGATALDDVDGDISEAIVTDTTKLNMARTGTYTVTYNLTDSSGNVATEVSRTVEVIAGDNPESVKNAITAFTIPGQESSKIDSDTYTIAVDVPYYTELNVAPSVLTVSDFASVSPDATAQQDFTAPVVYTVKAENDDEQQWTVTVTVGPKPIVAPVVEAGEDIVITLPTNSVTLNGSATDADGTVTTVWSLESGGNATIANPTSPNTAISGLTAGIYVFLITATDDDGATDTDTVMVRVNNAPIIDAGRSFTIQLPTNSANLLGVASDSDGTFTSNWVQTSGPTAIIENPNSLTTRVTGLTTKGMYVFRLDVTDNHGATSSDSVNIEVLAANVPPTVNAGPNETTTLMSFGTTTSVNLSGTANDADGTVTVQWTKRSGGSATIVRQNSKTTTVNGLAVGTYTFRLTATDSDGAIVFDEVTVTVNKYVQPPTASFSKGTNVDSTTTYVSGTVTITGGPVTFALTVYDGGTVGSGTSSTLTLTVNGSSSTVTASDGARNDKNSSTLSPGTYSYSVSLSGSPGSWGFANGR